MSVSEDRASCPSRSSAVLGHPIDRLNGKSGVRSLAGGAPRRANGRSRFPEGRERGMAPESGLEPETFRLGGGRSILLSYKGEEESYEFNALPVYHRERRGTTREVDQLTTHHSWGEWVPKPLPRWKRTEKGDFLAWSPAARMASSEISPLCPPLNPPLSRGEAN